MEIAISSRQSAEYLQKTDEIRVQYRDKDIIYDFIEQYPNKTFILEIPFYVKKEEIDYKEIISFSKMAQNFICRISCIEDILIMQNSEVNWYYGMVIDKWDDLMGLAAQKPAYVLIGGDLFFNLPKVKEFNIPVRAVPNVSSISPLMRSNFEPDISIVGDWFQPEAVDIYKPYIEAIEFENCSLQQERALCRIYGGNGWPGKLTDIITNLKTEAEGRLINPDIFYKNRLECGRKCLMYNNAGCQLCYRQFAIGNYEKLKAYKEEVLESEGAD